MEEKYFTTKELTEYFRISRFALHRANKSGALPVAKKDGVTNLYRESDVKRYIEQVGTSDGVSVQRDGLTYQYSEVEVQHE